MSVLTELLVRRNDSIPLDVAAIQVAAIEFPGLVANPTLNLLDSLAERLQARLPDRSGDAYVRISTDFLFRELGFHGNQEDYYNPHNSCLNAVLESHTGIPISLSILYIEVSRRLGRRVYGVGMPGHFLVRYNDAEYATFIDPFHGGRLLTAEECLAMGSELTGQDLSGELRTLQPSGNREIVLRMLHNLRAVYFRSRSYQKALQVLDLLIEADPLAGDTYKQRALVNTQLRYFGTARADLERYLMLFPEASDRAEVEQHLVAIKRRLASLN